MSKTAIVLPRLAPNVPGFFLGYSLWAGVSCAHYFVCGAIAHWMGSPFNLPHWLDGINRFFRYGLSGFVDLLVLALWWLILALAAAVFAVPAIVLISRFIPDKKNPPELPHDSRIVREDFATAAMRGTFSAIPLMVMSLLTLAILPMYSHNAPAAPSNLELAPAMTWNDYVGFMIMGLCSVFYIFVLFAGLFGAVAVVTEYKPNAGGCAFFHCILFGILLCLIVGLSFSPLVDILQLRCGAEKTYLIVFAGMALILLPPSWLFLGRIGPPDKDESKKDEPTKTAQ